MRRRMVQRSKARGRGVGRWCHRYSVCRFAVHMRTQGQHLWIFPLWDQVSKKLQAALGVTLHKLARRRGKIKVHLNRTNKIHPQPWGCNTPSHNNKPLTMHTLHNVDLCHRLYSQPVVSQFRVCILQRTRPLRPLRASPTKAVSTVAEMGRSSLRSISLLHPQMFLPFTPTSWFLLPRPVIYGVYISWQRTTLSIQYINTNEN